MTKLRVSPRALVALLAFVAAGASAASVARDGLRISFDPATHFIRLADEAAGSLFTQGVLKATLAGQPFASNAPGVKVASDAEKCQLVLSSNGRPVCRLRLVEGARLVVETTRSLEGQATWECQAAMGERPLPGILADERAADRAVLITRLGPAPVGPARSLFDPQRDLALSASSPGRVRWLRKAGWELVANAPAGGQLLTLRVRRHYYRDELGIRHYAPMKKRKRWPTAPVVAMTWYGIQGWRSRPSARSGFSRT